MLRLCWKGVSRVVRKVPGTVAGKAAWKVMWNAEGKIQEKIEGNITVKTQWKVD